MIEESIKSLANQGSCKLPHLELNPPELMNFYKDEDPIICDPEESDWVKCVVSFLRTFLSKVKKKHNFIPIFQ